MNCAARETKSTRKWTAMAGESSRARAASPLKGSSSATAATQIEPIPMMVVLTTRRRQSGSSRSK